MPQRVAWLGATGLVLALAALVSASAGSLLGPAWIWLALGALVLLGAYLAAGGRRVGGTARRGARLGGQTALTALIFVVCLVLLNVLAAGADVHWDLTRASRYTLTPQTRQVLAAMRQPVKILAFYGPGQGAMAKMLLEQYARHSSEIRLRFVDPNRQPALAQRYGVRNPGAIVFAGGSTRQQVPDLAVGQAAFTAALVDVTAKPATVCLLGGHGERQAADITGPGYAGTAKALVDQGYRVRTVDLAARQRVPRDCAVLVVADPRVPFLAGEVREVAAYLQRGGKAFFLAEPSDASVFAPLVAPFGMDFSRRTVYDSQDNLGGQDPLTPLVTGYGFSPLTLGLPATYFPTAAAVRQERAVKGVSVHPLVLTSPQTWLLPAGQNRPRPGTPPLGRVSLLTAVDGKGGQLVLAGDADFADNQNNSLGNRQLFLRAVGWLARPQAAAAAAAAGGGSAHLILSPAHQRLIFYVTVVFLPLGLLLAAGMVWWGRR